MVSWLGSFSAGIQVHVCFPFIERKFLPDALLYVDTTDPWTLQTTVQVVSKNIKAVLACHFLLCFHSNTVMAGHTALEIQAFVLLVIYRTIKS